MSRTLSVYPSPVTLHQVKFEIDLYSLYLMFGLFFWTFKIFLPSFSGDCQSALLLSAYSPFNQYLAFESSVPPVSMPASLYILSLIISHSLPNCACSLTKSLYIHNFGPCSARAPCSTVNCLPNLIRHRPSGTRGHRERTTQHCLLSAPVHLTVYTLVLVFTIYYFFL